MTTNEVEVLFIYSLLLLLIAYSHPLPIIPFFKNQCPGIPRVLGILPFQWQDGENIMQILSPTLLFVFHHSFWCCCLTKISLLLKTFNKDIFTTLHLILSCIIIFA